ncbi:cache domain-containing protein [Desulfogranum marinum]|uniref:cache domain-containing protein n=1 Tax=Desulfogranum marinum TaxID=453220 RepID=UPI0019624680|nr:cache domain-containing protein [Desulfogranum marinum]MBM9513818.1 cache domain-containing protein [Desulfogranum marinum]
MQWLRRLSFQGTITASIILIIMLVYFSVGALWVADQFIKFDAEAKARKEAYVQEHKAVARMEVDRIVDFINYQRRQTERELKVTLRARVEEAINIAQTLYAGFAGSKSEQEVKLLITEALRNVRFDGGAGYFFIYDLDGNNILLPFSPELEGTNMIDLKDSKGGYTVRRGIELIKTKGEGFLNWYWYEPDKSAKMKEKLGFIKSFEPLGWYIGTGTYLENYTQIIQQRTLGWINQVRYGEEGYIFVYDYEGTTLAHYKPENIGVNRWTFMDSNGTAVLQEFIRMARNEGSGFLEYVGTIRPSTGLPAPKVGYSRGVDGWQWMVGSGLYVDAINQTLALKRRALIEKIQNHAVIFLFILLVSMVPIILLSRYLTRGIGNNIVLFTDFLEQSLQDVRKIEAQDVHFKEFQGLVRAANRMVDRQEKAAEDLKNVQEQLVKSQKMEALGLLASGVAHDLNNILSSMIGYPDLIMNSLPPDSPQRKPITIIKEAGLQAANVVEDLLTLARRGVEQRMVLNLNNLIEKYLGSSEYTKMLEQHPEVVVDVELESELMKMKGAPLHLEKTILNLVNNAIEVQPQGGHVLITTENKYVDHFLDGFQQVKEGEYVVLRVVDQGDGIAQEDIGHVFEPFFSKKRLGKSGTGLGLAVVWATLQDHEGFVNVTSEERKGTTFELFFRATREDIAQEVRLQNQNDVRGHGERLLVVDDVVEQRDLAVAILTQLGYQADAVSSGEEALAYLQRQRVDLVVLDMILADPYMDGLETYKRIVQLYPGQKAIIASGYAETARVKAAMMLGVGQYLKKPYTVEKIGLTIKRVLAEPRR